MKNLINKLIFEKNNNIRNGIYGVCQRSLAYNSNKIEGSTLSEEETHDLFVNGKLYATKDNVYIAKDIEEMTGHFAMFNYMLDTINTKLSLDVIKGFHKMLKQGVFEDKLNGYAVGEFKTRKNVVGVENMETCSPENVESEMLKLLEWYNKCDNIGIDELADFHEKYEKIHPFQDGNGRTGRIILFRECLRNGISPIIIQDKNRREYYNSLKEAHAGNSNTLIGLFLKEQNELQKELVKFDDNDISNNNDTLEL